MIIGSKKVFNFAELWGRNKDLAVTLDKLKICIIKKLIRLFLMLLTLACSLDLTPVKKYLYTLALLVLIVSIKIWQVNVSFIMKNN